jgi:hypothetical protein
VNHAPLPHTDGAGLVVGFEIESPKTEVRIKNLRLQPRTP